jgi:hypothetical protein
MSIRRCHDNYTILKLAYSARDLVTSALLPLGPLEKAAMLAPSFLTNLRNASSFSQLKQSPLTNRGRFSDAEAQQSGLLDNERRFFSM